MAVDVSREFLKHVLVLLRLQVLTLRRKPPGFSSSFQ